MAAAAAGTHLGEVEQLHQVPLRKVGDANGARHAGGMQGLQLAPRLPAQLRVALVVALAAADELPWPVDEHLIDALEAERACGGLNRAGGLQSMTTEK